MEGFGWDDVFLLETASIDRALSTVDPVFAFPDRVVIDLAVSLQPIKHLEFRFQIWVNSV
jgi:hypothetical protein